MLKLVLAILAGVGLFHSTGYSACRNVDGRQLFSLQRSLQQSTGSLPRYIQLNSTSGSKLFRTQDVLTDVMGWPGIDLISMDVSDLRFLPYNLPRSRILFVTDSENVITKTRMNRIIAVANFYGIQISVLWLSHQQSQRLKEISLSTGGQFTTKDEILAMSSCVS